MTNDLPRVSPTGGVRPDAGIVHLGPGAFFRAFGAIYLSEAMLHSGGDWGVIGVSLVRPVQRDLLEPQGFAYTAVELGPGGYSPKVIDIVQDVLVARENPEIVIGTLARPQIRIVSLTITEKGYCHEPSTGTLDLTHPDIVHDLGNASHPVSAPGILVRALQRRRAAGLAAFTVLSCDNLPDNGTVAKDVVTSFAEQIDPELARWIEQNAAFPCTMVDRIVPRTKPADIELVARLTGTQDHSPVMHEPFRQWVIEDTFVDGQRPDFEAVGVEMVDDVRPFELMKLRCLNGTHSALAYLGYLAGHKTIFDTVEDDIFRQYTINLWRHEIIPGLKAPPGVNLSDYTDSLLSRYSNPAIGHLTWQIAMDGSQKLPQRILDTLHENLLASRPVDGLVLSVAAWMRYVNGIDENGESIDVRDPMAERLRTLSDSEDDASGKVTALLSVSEIFSGELAANASFRTKLIECYQNLIDHGASATVAELTT